MRPRWNHNLEYHRVVHDALGRGGRLLVLDGGCGDGTLGRELAAAGHRVVGLDADAPMAALAGVDLAAVAGDLRAAPFRTGTFDAVVSVAALHHVGADVGLRGLAELVRPGGTLVVVGLARWCFPADLPWELAGAGWTRLRRLRRTWWETPAPKVWPPPETYAEVRRTAERLLPGVRYRRHVLRRYSLVWRRPPGPGSGTTQRVHAGWGR